MRNNSDSRRYLVISGHDYRSKRKANMHFIARELATRGSTRFFSIGFSFLSKFKKDPRSSLWNDANQIVNYRGVDCYLWRTFLHPFNLHNRLLSLPSRAWFQTYVRSAPHSLRDWIEDCDTIILESGMSPIFFDLIKEHNPKASILYICSDALETIDCAPFVVDELRRISPQLSGIRIPSIYLASEFSDHHNVFLVPHGMDPISSLEIKSNPYNGGTNVVSVGEMLFDKSFFEIAAIAFPQIRFHVIGGGPEADKITFPNVTVYQEMAYLDTLPYIKYASVGVAPYNENKVAKYLVDTSMKLAQFSTFGLPAVCPTLVAGLYRDRFGYEPGNRASIVTAINSAIAHGRFEGRIPLKWNEVVDRILTPQDFPEASISGINQDAQLH